MGADGGVYNFGTQGFYGLVPGSLKPGQSLVAPGRGHRGDPLGQRLLGGGGRRRSVQLRRCGVPGLIYTAIPGQKLNGPIVGIQHLGATAA